MCLQEAAAAEAQRRLQAGIQALQADNAALRQQLADAQTAAGSGRGSPARSPVDTANAAAASAVRPWGRPSDASTDSGGTGGGAPASWLPAEEVTWGRTLSSRAPVARPKAVPPMDLSRLAVPR